MVITLVQGNARGTSTSNSISVTMTSAPTNGNFLFAVIGLLADTMRTVSIINQAGVTWTKIISQTYTTYNQQDVEVWQGVVGAGGETLITITLSGNANYGAVADVCEWSGIAETPLDKTASAYGYSANPVTGTTAETTQTDELCIGGISFNNRAQSNPINDFTLLDGVLYTETGYISVAYLYKIVSSIGTASSGTTATGTEGYVGCIATFKAAAPPPVIGGDFGQKTSLVFTL